MSLMAAAGSFTVSMILPRPVKSISTMLACPLSPMTFSICEVSILLTVAVVPDTLALTWTVLLSPDTGTVMVELPGPEGT